MKSYTNVLTKKFQSLIGVDEENDLNLSLEEARIDKLRIEYHQDHLFNIQKAIQYIFIKLSLYIYIYTLTCIHCIHIVVKRNIVAPYFFI